MKNWIFIFCFVLTAASIVAQNPRGFESFRAPGVSGAFCNMQSPLGPTDKGLGFSIGFYLSGDDESSPVVMWIPNSGGQNPKEVRSLGDINAVARQITAGEAPESVTKITIEVARRIVSSTIVNKGSGGFALDPGLVNRPEFIISRLRKAGLAESDVAMVEGLAKQARFEIGEHEWTRIWFEIDSLGSVTKVTARGAVTPPAIKSVQMETVFESGRIDPDILKRERSLQMDVSVRLPD
jgi:hypothetical protein